MKTTDDDNVAILDNVLTPYSIARKVLTFVKNEHEDLQVRGVV